MRPRLKRVVILVDARNTCRPHKKVYYDHGKGSVKGLAMRFGPSALPLRRFAPAQSLVATRRGPYSVGHIRATNRGA